MKVRLSADEIAKNIAKLEKNAERDLIQETAVNCTLHALETGDVTLADKLLAAIKSGGGWKWKRLSVWLTTYGPFNYKTVKKSTKITHNPKNAEELKPKMDANLVAFAVSLSSKLWWDCETPAKEPTKKPVALSAALKKLIDKAKENGSDDPKLLEAVASLLPTEEEEKKEPAEKFENPRLAAAA